MVPHYGDPRHALAQSHALVPQPTAQDVVQVVLVDHSMLLSTPARRQVGACDERFVTPRWNAVCPAHCTDLGPLAVACAHFARHRRRDAA